MYYNKYSNFFPDQIITEDYQELCDTLLSVTTTEHTKEIMKRNII